MSLPNNSQNKKTALLLILDGWGHSDNPRHNAIAAANTPVWDKLWNNQPHTLITTSGSAVGLPEGQMGNSEVGHMNLGAGRIVYQNFTRIKKDIEEGGFFHNEALNGAVDKANSGDKAMHIFGLLSPGGIHSHEDQILSLIDLAINKGCKKLFVHAFLDGGDTPPRSALESLQRTDKKLRDSGCGQIVSIIGRYFPMDRDSRWDRIQSAYDLITAGKSEFVFDSVTQALDAAYERGENDEFVQATRIRNENALVTTMQDGDSVVFMNFRSDRARQLTRAFVNPAFADFQRDYQPQLADFVMLTQYAADIDTTCAYPSRSITNDFGEYLSSLGKTQLRIAETEKYAHVTFFFSGGREEPYVGEERVLVPSPSVATYDLKPEMSAYEVTQKLVQAIGSGEYDAIICNYANGDMVGHTGDFNATVKAIETVDLCLGQIAAAIESVDGHCLVTADHGNVEQMVDESTGQPLTSHTSGPVPLIYIGRRPIELREGGSLADIAPTLLSLMKIAVPDEMSGTNLAVFLDDKEPGFKAPDSEANENTPGN